MTLTLGPGLTLPLEAVTETFAILAKRGSGKTYTAAVLVEELHAAGQPVVVIDPIGVWWGLRSSADGQGDGLPFVVFGGDHADVPLEETAGDLLADLVVDERIAAVLDLSLLSKGAARRFMTAFLERLYRRNREPLHVVLDEADAWAPQRTSADGARLLGAVEDLVRRGRARGLGVTLITQRPAVLSKDVLTQAEVLIALRMTGVRDVAAIDEWVRLHADEDQAVELKRSLPALPVGTAWVWSPGWLGVLQQVQVRRRRTFDSSATPKPGQVRVEPRRLAPVDLDRLGQRMAETVERAKADDPKALRARVRALEEQLAAREERVEVPVLDEELVALLRHDLRAADEVLRRGLVVLAQATEALHGARTAELPAGAKEGTGHAPSMPAGDAGTPTREVRPPQPAAGGPLGKTERRILTVLVQHGPRTHRQLALQTGYSAKASTIGVSLGKLRRAGLVEPGQPITATAAAAGALGEVEHLPTGEALLRHWREQFGKTERVVLDVLAAAYPAEVRQHDLAARTGYSPTASTIGVALGKLRRLELVDGWRLSDDFAASVGL